MKQIILILVMFLTALPVVFSSRLDEKLLHCYPLDTENGSGFTPDYNGSADLNNSGNATLLTSGCAVGSGCYEFNGDAWLRSYENVGISGNENRTVTFWVKRYSDAPDNERIFHWGQDGQNTVWAAILDSNAHMELIAFSNDYDTGVVVSKDWEFWAITFNGSQVVFYRDGDKVAYTSKTYSTIDSNLYIGAHGFGGAGSYLFNGIIDEVAIWNRTLSFNETLTVYDYNRLGTSCMNFGEKNVFVHASIYDEVTKELLNGTTVNLELVSDNYADEYSTNTGELYFAIYQSNPSEDYRISFSADGYVHRTYYINLTSGATTSLNLYLLSEGNATAVNLFLTDNYDQELEGYYVYLMRHYVSSNSYETVEVVKTDIDGMARHQVQMYDVFYKWVFKNPSGETVRITEGQPIYLTTLNYQLNLGEMGLDDYEDILGIKGFISWVNDTGVVTFSYSDDSGLSGQYCLKVSKIDYFGSSDVYHQCQTSPSGSLSYTISDFDSNYQAQGYTIHSGSAVYLTPIAEKSIIYKRAWKTDFSTTGLILHVIFIFSLTVVGLVVGGGLGAILGGIVGLGVFGFLGITNLHISTFVGLSIMGGLLIWKLGKK